MEQNNAFKSSLFGFDKKMVLDYILQFNQQVQHNEQQLVARITELDELRQRLEAELADRDARLTEVIKKHSQASQSAADNEAMLEKLSEEVVRLRSLVEEKDREIQIQNERCRQLQFKAESLEIKTKREDGSAGAEAADAAEPAMPAAPAPVEPAAPAVAQPAAALEAELRRIKADFAALSRRVEALESRTGPRISREDSFFRSRNLPR